MSDSNGKIILCGGTTVGKTTLMRALCQKNTRDPISPTMAAGFSSLTITQDDKELQFNLWDTAGQEAYRSLIKVYFRSVDVALILFDVTNKQTFEQIGEWVSEIQENAYNDTFKIILVGNKIDLENREVTLEDIVHCAKENYAQWCEISALEELKIDELKQLIASVYLDQSLAYMKRKEKDHAAESVPVPPSPSVAVGKKQYSPIIDESNPNKKSGCC